MFASTSYICKYCIYCTYVTCLLLQVYCVLLLKCPSLIVGSGFYTSCLEVARTSGDFDLSYCLSFFKNEGGIVVDNHDDMELPIREVGWYKG